MFNFKDSFTKLSTAGWIAIIQMIGIVVLFMFINAQFNNDTKLETYIEELQIIKDEAIKLSDSLKVELQLLEEHVKSAEQRASQLTVQVGGLRVQTSKLKNSVDSLKSTLTDSVQMARMIIPLQDSIIIHQDSVINTQEQVIEEKDVIIFTQKNSIYLLTQAFDSVTAIIINIPEPPNPNEFLGITLPSRKESVIGGFIIGVVVSLAVKR